MNKEVHRRMVTKMLLVRMSSLDIQLFSYFSVHSLTVTGSFIHPSGIHTHTGTHPHTHTHTHTIYNTIYITYILYITLYI